MPFDHAGAGTRSRPSLRESAVELMLRAQFGDGLDNGGLRAELRRLAAAARAPAGDLWAAYTGDRASHRSVRRRYHAALTLG